MQEETSTISRIGKWQARALCVFAALIIVSAIEAIKYSQLGYRVYGWIYYYSTTLVESAIETLSGKDYACESTIFHIHQDHIMALGDAVCLLPGIVIGLALLHRMRFKIPRDGQSRCRQCGYDLRGGTTRCPECGESV